MTAKARFLDDGIPSTDPQLSRDDLETLEFIDMILDRDDGHHIDETDHPDGYNMLIMHPKTNHIHWAYTWDFDFI